MAVSSIFSQSGGGTIQNDNGQYTLGMQFTVSSTVNLTGIWWFSAATATVLPTECAIFLMTGPGAGSKVAGTDHVSPSWSGAAGSGWVKCSYNGTVNLTSGNTYKVAIQLPGAATFQYSATGAYWTTGAGGSGITNGPLTAVNNAGGDGGQDTFKVTSTMAYPTTSSGANNYWVDVEVSTSPPPGPPPPPPPPPRRAPGRARTGSRALCAAGIAVAVITSAAGVAGTPPKPFPVSHPQPARGHTGPAGRNAGGQHSGSNQALITAVAPRQFTQPRRPGPVRALAKGQHGPANHGYANPPGIQPRIGHPQPQRAIWRSGAAPGNVAFQSYAPTLPVMTQPRLVPQRVAWRGQAAPPPPPPPGQGTVTITSALAATVTISATLAGTATITSTLAGTVTIVNDL